MFTFICRRLIISIPTLLAVMSIIFILVRIVPGDPAQTILGDQASASALDAMRERLAESEWEGLRWVYYLLTSST